jgi:hypothetical protein
MTLNYHSFISSSYHSVSAVISHEAVDLRSAKVSPCVLLNRAQLRNWRWGLGWVGQPTGPQLLTDGGPKFVEEAQRQRPPVLFLAARCPERQLQVVGESAARYLQELFSPRPRGNNFLRIGFWINQLSHFFFIMNVIYSQSTILKYLS